MLHNLFIVISPPLDDYGAECKQFGVCLAGDRIGKSISGRLVPMVIETNKFACRQ